MDFSAIKEHLDNRDKNMMPFCEMTVYRDGKQLYSYRDTTEAFPNEFEDHDMYWLFSCSKVMTCTAFMRLVERGKCSLSDPVSKYLPEFADVRVQVGDALVPADRSITLEDAISMSSGLTYEIVANGHLQKLLKENPHASTREVMKAIAANRLVFQPGTDYRYSLGHDVIGAVCEVVTGMKFRDYMRTEIFEPLGMKDTFMNYRDFDRSRIHTQFLVSMKEMKAQVVHNGNMYILTDNYDCGGAGVMTTHADHAKFLDALACGKLLRKETMDNMRTNRLCPKALSTFWGPNPADSILTRFQGYGYGLGVRELDDPQLQQTYAPKGEFGWDGAAGCLSVVDPDRHISICFSTQVNGSHYGFYFTHRAVKSLVFKAFED